MTTLNAIGSRIEDVHEKVDELVELISSVRCWHCQGTGVVVSPYGTFALECGTCRGVGKLGYDGEPLGFTRESDENTDSDEDQQASR